MGTRKNGRKPASGPRDLLARRMLAVERQQGAILGLAEVSDVRLGRVETLLGQVVELLGAGFRDLREDLKALGGRMDRVLDELRDLRVDHARIDRLDERVTRIERQTPPGSPPASIV